MNNNTGVTVIIPAYNESSSIVSTILEITKLKGKFEIIAVDDASTDNTFELAKETGVKVLRHSKNKGYGASIKTGMKNAQYDIIVTTDADKTYQNEKIPEMLEIFLSDNCDMVVGARTHTDVNIPKIRRPAKWFITKLANFLTGMKIPDLNSGLRVMKKSVVQKYLRILPDGFSFSSTITLAMLCNGFYVKYLPINYYKRQGKSKIRPLRDTINFVQLIIRTVLYFDPLKIFLPLSLPIILSGFLLMCIQGIIKRNITTLSVVVLFTGFQLLAIGMLADLIDKRLN